MFERPPVAPEGDQPGWPDYFVNGEPHVSVIRPEILAELEGDGAEPGLSD